MFDFFETNEKRRAFKKALKEIIHEQPAPVVLRDNKQASTSGAAIPPKPISPSLRSPFNKPETTFVDLKNFKDWRKVDVVKSNNPLAPQKQKPKTFDDLFDQPSKEMPGGDFVKRPPQQQTSTADIIDRFSTTRKETTDTSFNTFFDSKPEPEHKKISLQDIINRNATATPLKEKPDTVKVEVVDFTKPKPEPKPKTNRKPRGKSKRRFDADVISSVDWK